MSKSRESNFAGSMDRQQPSAVRQHKQRSSKKEIASRAYGRWQEKGCPGGSAKDDWLRAEHELELRALSALSPW